MMKTQLPVLFAILVCVGVLLCPARLSAQAAGGEGQGQGRLNFLSADDRAHLLKVREQVLASNPDLKAEQESLEKERESVKNKGTDASADDRKTMWQNMRAHNEKMQAAMEKADPTIAPVLEQVNAKMKERFQQRAGQGGEAGATNQ